MPRAVKRRSMRGRTADLELVRRALALGWKPAEDNATAVRHFYFFAPQKPGQIRGDVTVSWFNSDSPSFTVGDTSTSDESTAISMLRAFALTFGGSR